MVNHYNIDPNRIYLYGISMGAQVGEVMVAKFPSLFAAAYFTKGPSDWTKWHQQTQVMINQGYSQSFHRQWMERECYVLSAGTPTPQNPAQNPFCYASRSSLNYARNLIHVPISMTHSISDVLVPVSHSYELRDAVNSFGPDYPVKLHADSTVGPTCTDKGSKDPGYYYHCLEDDPVAVTNYLAQFTRNARPLTLDLATTQAQFFYWLKVGSVGNNSWATIKADADLAKQTVRATITSTTPLVMSFNLGQTPVTEIIPHPGAGFTPTTFLVQEQGRPSYLATYNSGYLDVPLNTTGSFNLTISALEVIASANPATRNAGQAATSTITVLVRDRLQQLAPDNTDVTLTTTAGKFANNSTTYVGKTVNGQLTVALSLAASDGAASILAKVGNATGSASVAVSGGATVTPTPTNPPTATPTATPIATAPPTATPTAPPTVTAPPTATSTATPIATPTATATPPPSGDLIFADDFESGNLLAWPQRNIDNGDLAASSEAALAGNVGMLAVVDDNNPLAVGDYSPDAEKSYQARFHFDPNSMAMAQGDAHELFRGFTGTWPAVLDVQIRRWNGSYQVRAGILGDNLTWRYSLWFALSDEPHALEVGWQAASAPGANDGHLRFWIDNTLRSELLGIDNDTRQIDLVRLGAISSIDAGTRGSYRFDAFESRNQSYIGPAAGGVIGSGTPDPAGLHEWVEEAYEKSQLYLPLTSD